MTVRNPPQLFLPFGGLFKQRVRVRPFKRVEMERDYPELVYVGRAVFGWPRSFWANPFRVGTPDIPDNAAAVARFRQWLEETAEGQERLGRIPELAGRLLGCWCRLDEPCHADVLIELANGPVITTRSEKSEKCCRLTLPN